MDCELQLKYTPAIFNKLKFLNFFLRVRDNLPVWVLKGWMEVECELLDKLTDVFGVQVFILKHHKGCPVMTICQIWSACGLCWVLIDLVLIANKEVQGDDSGLSFINLCLPLLILLWETILYQRTHLFIHNALDILWYIFLANWATL